MGTLSKERGRFVRVTLRPFEERDYPRLVEIHNLNFRDYLESVAEWRHNDSTWDQTRYFRQRLVAETEAGLIAGWGELCHMRYYFHPDKYAINVQVCPACQRRGIGGAIYERLMGDLRAHGAVAVFADTFETNVASLAFLGHRGFVEERREWESRLDVTRFDFTRFPGPEERIAQYGVALTSLAEAGASNPDVLRRVYELYMEAEHDVPASVPYTPVPLELWRANEVDAPTALLDGFFLAQRDGEYVGVSNLHRSLSEPGVINQGLTAVRRVDRGRGIALALKLQTVRYARERGYHEIRTWNDSRNAPMLRINTALGFARRPAWIEFRKALRDPAR